MPLLNKEAEVDLPVSEISTAEEERYWDAAAVPTIVVPDAGASTTGSRSYLDYVRGEPAQIDLGIREPPVAEAVAVREAVREARPEPPPMLERPPSAMFPLMVVLAVGLTIGFAAGYGMGSRQRAAPAAPPPPAATVPAAAVREFTESAVAATPPAEPVTALPTPEVDRPKPEANLKPEVSNLQSQNAAGRLLVRSTPAGALVFVDGREYGPTPAAVRDLSSGGHRVRVVRDGYAAAERRVVISPSHPSQSLTIALERPANAGARAQTAPPPALAAPGSQGRFSGVLTVVSRPPGAAVFLDGKLVGTTPLSLPSVQAGSHAIRIENEGYRRWTSAIRIVASEQNRITASLER